MNKKTILFVHQSSDLYGSDKTLLILVNKLNKNIFRPIVVLPRKGPLLDELKKQNIKIIITPVINIHKRMFNLKELFLLPYNLIKSIHKLHKELKGIKIDIVQSNTVVVTLGFIYARLKKIKHFWHIHEVLESPKVAVTVFSWLVKVFSDFTIFNSIATQKSYCKRFPVIKEKSVIIYNGLDRELEITSTVEQIKLRDKLEYNSNDVILGLVGRINENKGHILLLNSFNEIIKKQTNIKLLFIGSVVKGKKQVLEILKKQIVKLGLKGKVKILPFQKQIWKFWDIIDIAVVPSTIPESFGLVALEAMLACKPVIASNLGALKEVVKNNTTGFLFDINDKKDFENKIQVLSENKELREEYGIAGYSRAIITFNIEKYIYQFEQKYLED